MGRLLDDLLDISRITRGTLELKKSPLELADVIGDSVEAARPFLEAKGHDFELRLPDHPVPMEADPVRLAQVFSNLLINAAKYTGEGGRISLTAANGAGEVVVTVRDNGMGIAPEMMPRLFTLFSQAQTTIARSQDGLGVGLALVRGLVSLHGGRVEAHSEGPGRGSEFVVRLPAAALQSATPAPEPADESAATASLRVLVVDDNRDAADSCATLLELSGHRVAKAYLGGQALELGENFEPQVVLLDIGLPDVCGYDVARRIRAAAWGSAATLVAVTGWGQESDRNRAFEAGFDHHLTKPVAAEDLESLMRKLASEPAAA
jgi:CheY-like chemotaxis protein